MDSAKGITRECSAVTRAGKGNKAGRAQDNASDLLSGQIAVWTDREGKADAASQTH